MKKIVLLIFILLPNILQGQIISTWMGGGVGGGIDGLGDGCYLDSAKFTNPGNCFFDKQGNFYFVDNLGGRVRKVDTMGIVRSIAGNGNNGYNGDEGLADTSEVCEPTSVITDTLGNVFIADPGNNRIRRIDRVTGVISTIAGTGVANYGSENTPASNTELFHPNDIWFDRNENLIIAEITRVRKVNNLGIITTIAGYNNTGYISTVNGGLADTTAIGAIGGVTTDKAGNIYISDYHNYKVYKIDNQGFIITIAGSGNGYVYNGDNVPAVTVQLEPGCLKFNTQTGNLFISDIGNNRMRMIDGVGIIHTVAGNGTMNYTGDGGLADTSGLPNADGLAFDNCGNLYIAQVSIPAVIRKVTFDTACHIHAAQGTIDTTKTGLRNIVTADIKMYPSPAMGVLHVDVSACMQYRLMNLVGIVVQQGVLKAGSNSVNVKNLVSGIYVMEVSNEWERVVRKIVKQ